MDEYLTEEVYYYDTMDEAEEDMERMRAERACNLAFDTEDHGGRIRMTVKVGE